MKLRQGLLAAAVLGGTFLFSSRAFAIPQSDTISYVTDQPNYSTTLGGTVTVNVFLNEVVVNTTSIINGDKGLLAGGWSITQNTNTSTPSIVSIIDSGNFSNGSSENPGDAPDGTAATYRALDNLAGTGGAGGPKPSNGANGGTIPLGVITIQGLTATTTFTLANYKYPAVTGGYTQTFQSAYDLDNSSDGRTALPADVVAAGGSAGAENFTVTVTPEPGTMAVVGLSGIGLLLRRRRRIGQSS